VGVLASRFNDSKGSAELASQVSLGLILLITFHSLGLSFNVGCEGSSITGAPYVA
jgi:hypothetical protein